MIEVIMPQVIRTIILGGGDGGILQLTPTGIRRIGPMPEPLRHQLKGLNALVQAENLMHEKNISRSQLGFISNLTETVLHQIEALVGKFDGEYALIYLEGDDGFYCGTKGPRPFPLPKPKAPQK